MEKYQDGVLMERKYKCGKNNKWKRKKYPKYETKHRVDPTVKEVYDDQEFYKHRFPNLDHMFPNYFKALHDNKEKISSTSEQDSYSVHGQLKSTKSSVSDQVSSTSNTFHQKTSSLKISIKESNQEQVDTNDNDCNSDSEKSEVSVSVPFQKEQVSYVSGEFNYHPDNPHYPFL